MAMSMMIKKASTSVLPLAFRAISSARSLNRGSIFTALNLIDQTSHHYSTDVAIDPKLVDKSLRKVLRTQIKSAQMSGFGKQVPPCPSSFPFTIQDDPSERTITLTREFSGETIEVKVEMPHILLEDLEAKNDDSSSDNSGSDDEGNDSLSDKGRDSNSYSSDSDETDDRNISKDGDQEFPSVTITAIIRKMDGSSLKFEMLASAEEIFIEKMSIEERIDPEFSGQKYYGCTDFELLDPELQRSLLKYLETRGIKTSIVAFLYKYMVNKARREDFLWMKRLRKFVK